MGRKEMIPFNKWSRERIAQGRKFCTTRNRPYDTDPRVRYCMAVPLWLVRNFLWQVEGADSPEEFEMVWRKIHKGKFNPDSLVWIHFGDFR